MITRSLTVLFLSLIFLHSSYCTNNVLDQMGDSVRNQYAMYLKSNLSVLSIALEPGCEDLALLSYLRLGRGARVVNAYLTNGDSGITDTEPELPELLAARRRSEASAVLHYLDVGVHFFSSDYVPYNGSTADVKKLWNTHELQMNIMKLINTIRPDIVIVFSDRGNTSTNRYTFFASAVRTALYRMENPDSIIVLPSEIGIARWVVKQTFVESEREDQLYFPVHDRHPVLDRSYREIANDAAEFYESLRYQRSAWESNRLYSYTSLEIDVTGAGIADIIRAEMPVPSRLQWTADSVKQIAESILSGSEESSAVHRSKNKILSSIATTIDSLNIQIAGAGTMSGYERRLLFNWRLVLDDVRNALLGVRVEYSISDPVITPRQLTYLHIESVTGITEDGITEVYFPAAGNGWFVNESPGKVFPLHDEPFRMVSPVTVEFTYPAYIYDIKRHETGIRIPVYILHTAKARERSFSYRIDVPIDFAPRFTLEVLTPVVFARSGEHVIVRMTNHSRDGVSDIVSIKSEYVNSAGKHFALPGKGETRTDTLSLSVGTIDSDTTFTVPVFIGDEPLEIVTVRNFSLQLKGKPRIGMMSMFSSSPLISFFQILDIHPPIYLSPGMDLNDCDILIFDERVLTYIQPEVLDVNTVIGYINAGKKLIVLAQDEWVWNNSPLNGLFTGRDNFIYVDSFIHTDLIKLNREAYQRLANIISDQLIQ